MTDAQPVDKLPPLRINHPRINPEFAKTIRIVGLDVDGVLTDGGVYLGATASVEGAIPFELKRYDIQDGLGIHMLKEAGLHVVIVTGRVSDSVAMRARELGITHVVQDPTARKLSMMRGVAHELGCTLDEAAFIGDDLPDLSVMRAVALPVAVANACPEVKRVSRLQLCTNGGHGAIREFAETLLDARDEWIDLVERYVSRRSESEES